MKKSNFQLLALVMEKYDDQKQFDFFHPAGSSPSFSFPRRLDELVIRHAQVLMKTSLHVITSTGRVYDIPSADGLQATRTLLLNDL